jgi:hypothetical protein
MGTVDKTDTQKSDFLTALPPTVLHAGTETGPLNNQLVFVCNDKYN